MIKSLARRKRYFFFVLLIQGVLLFLIPEKAGISTSLWCSRVTIYSVVALSFQLVSLRLLLPPKSYLIPVFFILSYLYSFGQIYIEVAGYEIPELLRKLTIWGYSSMYRAVTLAFVSIAGVFLGISIYFTFFCKKLDFEITAVRKSLQPKIQFIIASLIIGFIADFSSLLYMAVVLGYGDVETTTPLYVLMRIVAFLLPMAVVFLLAREGLSLKAKTAILVLFVLYKLLCILSGYRGGPAITIVLMLYFYFRACRNVKLTPLRIVLLTVAAVVGIGFLVAIRETRTDTGADMEMVSTYMGENGDLGVLFNMLAESGVTLTVLCSVLEELKGEAAMGAQLFGSILGIIPGVSYLFQDFDFTSLSLDKSLGTRTLGGSFMSDLCFDFGDTGLLPASIFLGIILGIAFKSFDTAITRKQYVSVAFMFPIMVNLLFCIRSSLTKMPRDIVWYFIIFYCLWLLFSGYGSKLKFK